MKKFFPLNLLLVLGFSALLCSAQEQKDKDAPKPKYVPKDKIVAVELKVSTDRIEIIQAVLKKYFDKHADLESKETQEDIMKDIHEKIPASSKPADTRSPLAIQQTTESKVAAKFPKDLDQVRKEAEIEAGKKYPLAKKNDTLKVYYRRGGRVLAVSGKFYGYGLGGKTVRINSANIPVFDLMPESKALFDRESNAVHKRDFIKKQVRDYQMDRRRYADQLYNEEKTRIRQNNEKLGYIYYKDKWATAETVMRDHLKEMIKLAKERDEREKREKEEKEKNQQENGGGQAQDKTEEAEADE